MLTGEGRGPGPVQRAVVCALLTVPIVFLIGLASGFLLLLVRWQWSVALDAVLLLGATFLWTQTKGSWVTRAVAGSTVLATLVVAATAVPFWRDHSRHDARLDGMADELCAIDLPAGSTVGRCESSITNTGNGNSCRYLVRATVRPGDVEVLERALEHQGFTQSGVDTWGEPMADGKTYRRDGDVYDLTLQASWEPSENDIRCT